MKSNSFSNFLLFATLLGLLLFATNPQREAYLHLIPFQIEHRKHLGQQQEEYVYHNFFIFGVIIKHEAAESEKTVVYYGLLNHVFSCNINLTKSLQESPTEQLGHLK